MSLHPPPPHYLNHHHSLAYQPTMTTKPPSVLVLSLLVLCFGVALCTHELKQCQHQCRELSHATQKEKEQCMRRCEDGNGDEWDPRKEEARRCKAACGEEQSERAQRHCEDQCVGGHANYKKLTHQQEEGFDFEEKNSPFVFGEEHFRTTHETKHGRISVLRRFTDRSEVLRGVHNFRLAVLEAQPQTFIVPAHFDADILLFVAKGRGSVTMVRNKKQSFNLERGDIFKIPAGTQAYMTNRDDSEDLLIVKLLQPVALPAHFEAFHGTEPESFYNGFSLDVLEASLNTGRENLKKVFGQNQEGAIVEATKKQIQALAPSFIQPGTWPFGTDRNAPFSLFKQRPAQSNNFGKLFEASGDDYEALRDLDVMVSFANISRGAMMTPFYNSRATKISFVVDGEGWFEMACPHFSSGKGQEKGRGGRSFENVREPLRKGTVFVAPAGHPLVAVASETKNLQILCFEVNSKGNIRFPLAGKNNVISQMEKEAKELSFNVAAEVVDKVFESQKGEFFFAGPKKGHELQFGRSSI